MKRPLLDRNPWIPIIVFCAIIWAAVVILLFMAAGCSVDAPC